ncbi:Ras family protein [Vibrio chagasii]|nr:Ras family protein [Vibrio chagasii]CAH7335269.1 Ras family protein [Vibrio chagasii]
MYQPINELETWLNNTKEFDDADVKLQICLNENEYINVEDRFYAKALVKNDTLISLKIELDSKIVGIYKKLSELQLSSNIIELNAAIDNDDTNYISEFKKLEKITISASDCTIDLSQHELLTSVVINQSNNVNCIYPPNLRSLEIPYYDSNDISGNLQELPKSLREITIFYRHRNQKSSVINLDLLNNLNLSIIRIIGEIQSEVFDFDNHKNLKELLLVPVKPGLKIKSKIPKSIKKISIHNATIGEIYNHEVSQLDIFSLVHCNLPPKCIENIIKNTEIKDLTINIANSINLDFSKVNLSVENLDISHSNLTDISFIEKLVNLKRLDISYNPIENLPKNLPESLNTVIAKKCNIINIPSEYNNNFTIDIERRHLFDREAEGFLLVCDNPIESPPVEIIKNGKEATNEYFSSMRGPTSQLNEAKIIFVGDGAVGKTSLMKRLVHDQFDNKESQTDGIEIEPYKVMLDEGCCVKASIWDFGGQQILQATHQLFLSKRSIYVLVVEDRKNDLHKDQDIEQWLTQVNSLGGRPPILVVKNKIDENPRSDIQVQRLQSKFPNIVGFHEVSCETKHGLEQLHKALTECIRTLPMRKIELPKNWLDVKNNLKCQADKQDLLHLNNYTNLCDKYGINTKTARETLLKLLHDLGEVIAFDELKYHDTAILNPHWITEGVYALIRSDKLAENNGVISLSEAQKSLDNYSEHHRFENKAQYILDAMKTFELCHRTIENDTYLIPSLLPPQINLNLSEWAVEEDERIGFIFKFEHLLPPPLMPMLLVKLHEHIHGDKRWRTGAIITPSHIDAKAKIDMDKVAKEIRLIIIGSDRRDLLILLRSEINTLVRKLADVDELGLKELLPLGDSSERVSYNHLVGLKQMRVLTHPSGELGKIFSVHQLLGEIEPPEDTDRAIKTLLASQKNNGLFNINVMNQSNTNTATGGNATANNSQQQTATATANVDLKLELRAFKGQSEFVLEDIRDEIDELTSSDRKLKDYAIKECDKVEKAINELESNVEDQATADDNLRHFARVQNFLDSTLKKTNSVGKAIDQAGNIYEEVEKLAIKFNDLAGKFAMPTVALLGLGG